MKFKLYSIKDKKGDFMPPVTIKDDANAKRWFDNEVKTTPFMKEYAEDFDLYCTGLLFDSETGHILGNEIPEFIMSAQEVIISGTE